MTTMEDQIKTALRNIAATATEIAETIDADPAEVQATLIEMDDAGDVLMRNGWYRLSEHAKGENND